MYGDHGWNLGEHLSSPAGQRSGYVESVWVPMIFVGDQWPGPRGRSELPVGLLDIAPTVSDWLGVSDPNPWLGISLLQPVAPTRSVVVRRGSDQVVAFGEDREFSVAQNPETGRFELFAAADRLQRHDLATAHPDSVKRFERLLATLPELNDYLLEANRVWPASGR